VLYPVCASICVRCLSNPVCIRRNLSAVIVYNRTHPDNRILKISHSPTIPVRFTCTDPSVPRNTGNSTGRLRSVLRGVVGVGRDSFYSFLVGESTGTMLFAPKIRNRDMRETIRIRGNQKIGSHNPFSPLWCQ
jgi:hypothetical protein